MKSSEDLIVGQWDLAEHGRFPGVVDLTGNKPYFTLNNYDIPDLRLPSTLVLVNAQHSSEDTVTLLDLNQTASSRRGRSNYQEYIYSVGMVIVGGQFLPEQKAFNKVTFYLSNLTEEFHTLIKESTLSQGLPGENTKIEIELEKKEISQKSGDYELIINYGTGSGGRDGFEAKYKSYAYIEIRLDHSKNVEDCVEVIKEIEDLFTFLTKRFRSAEDIHLHRNNDDLPFPIKLMLPRDKSIVKHRSYLEPLFPLVKKEKVLKKIIHSWHGVFKVDSLNFRLFSSELTQKSQYLENTFFNIMSMIDNILLRRYGKKLNREVFGASTYEYTRERLERRCKDASFKDRLLLFMKSSDHKLWGKFKALSSRIKNDSNLDYDEFLCDIIINTRNAVAHGGSDRENLSPAYLISKFIGLWLLLQELKLNEDEIEPIINGIPIIFFES